MQNEFSTDHCYTPLQAADKSNVRKIESILKISCSFISLSYKDRNFF